jgi:hypothetical protein
MKKYLTIIFIILFSGLILAADALYLPNLGSSARMIALGNIDGFSRSSNAIFENPACLYRINNYSASIFATKLFDEVSYKSLSFGVRTDYGVFALGYMAAEVSGIPHTGLAISGNNNRSFFVDYYFKYDNWLAKLGHQLTLFENVYIGTALNYYENSMDGYKGRGFNMDTGAFLDWQPVQISVVFKNIMYFSDLYYSNKDDPEYSGVEHFPFQTVVTGIYNWGDFNILAQVKRTSDQPKLLKSLGLHYSPWFLKLFNLYGGYKEYYSLQNISNVYTIGVGLDLFDVEFNYAYEKSDHFEFDNNSYFSLSINF